MQLNQCDVSDGMAKNVIFTPPNSKPNEWNSKEIYIHGTDSKILSYLPKTEFKLIDVKEMLIKYKIAPLTGEIAGGGLSQADSPCSTSFGLLMDYQYNHYTLERIIEDYTSQKKSKLKSDETNPMQLIKFLDTPSRCEIETIIIPLAIIVGRLRVLGFNLKKELNYNNEGCVFKKISDLVYLAKSRYFLLYLIAKHLTINKKTQLIIEEETFNYTNSFNCDSFNKKIRETKIDFKYIFYDQSECNIQKLCDFMNSFKYDISTRRKTTIVDFKFEIRKHPITMPDVEKCDEEFLQSVQYSEFFIRSSRLCFLAKMKLLLSSYGIIDNRETTIGVSVNPGFFLAINESTFVNRAHAFDKMVNVIKEMIEAEEDPHIHITTPIDTFPLILLMENAKKVMPDRDEFRSCDNIVVGEDVSFMATNTMSNKEKLQAYIDSHNLNVEPCLFEDLKYLRRHSMTKSEFQQYIRIPPDKKLEKCIPCSPNDDSNNSVCFSIKNKLIGFFNWVFDFKVAAFAAVVICVALFPKAFITFFIIIQLIAIVWLKYHNKNN